MLRFERVWLGALLLLFPVIASAAVLVPVQLKSEEVLSSFRFAQTNLYIVRRGDTLWDLSRKLGVPLAELIMSNDITNPRLLQIGQKLTYHTDELGVSIPASTGPHKAESHPVVHPLASRSEGLPIFLPKGVQRMYCTLTAYSPYAESTGKNPGDPGFDITATGARAVEGVTVAVDPHIIPYGTKLYIPGIGFRVAEDTGSAIVGQHIDVFFNSVTTAVDFGVKRDVPVYILPNWYSLSRT